MSEPARESAPATELKLPPEYTPLDRRAIYIAGLAILIAIGAGLAAQVLTALIGFVTNLAFYGRISTAFVSPAGGHRAPLAILCIPVIGALLIGVMARYGSASIRGHGIPEVMERVLVGESRIPARVLFLKPVATAIAIGTGGPFGAEGPIIATGGALGSLTGQVVRITTDERKVLLASGAAAGMAATFGTPVSAVLLAVELLLFEYRARSLVPVALASAVAAMVRIAFVGTAPVFEVPALVHPTRAALAGYIVLGAVIGVLAALITRLTYRTEDLFEHLGERLNIHWMWWPAIGSVAVGVIGLVEPRTLGVGYENITGAIAGSIAGWALLVLVILKLASWVIYLSSGTSGGTMAPLFTLGAGSGALLGAGAAALVPGMGMSASVAGLVGMAAMFAGASHALLASVVLAFETTRQPVGLLPLLAGCTAAYLASLLVDRNSIMTEKLARRGMQVRTEYSADHLSLVTVRDAMSTTVSTLDAGMLVGEVRSWLDSGKPGSSHQGFPLLRDGNLVGLLTRRDLLDERADPATPIGRLIHRAPVVVYADSTLRDAADQMVLELVGRLPVVERAAPRRVVGLISRSDLLAAHRPRLEAARQAKRVREPIPRWPWMP